MTYDFQRPFAVNCSTDMPKFLHDLFEYENIPAGHNRADFFAELLNTYSAETKFTLVDELKDDAEAKEVLEHVQSAYERATFECPCCESLCRVQHCEERVRPLVNALAYHPAFVDSAFLAEHESTAISARAMHAWQQQVYHEVLPAYGENMQGVYYLQYHSGTTPEGRRQLEIALDRHAFERVTTPGDSVPAYRCCRPVPHGIENVTLTLGNVQWPVYITIEALTEFEQDFGRAFTSRGKAATLWHLVNWALADKWLWGSPMDNDSDDDGIYLDFTVGGIPCGHFWGHTSDEHLVFVSYSPYAATEVPYGKKPAPHEEPVAVLAELLAAPNPLPIPQAPNLSDAAFANLVTLAAELRGGRAPANDVAALRELLARKAGSQEAVEDPVLVAALSNVE
jgi:hypothetical protein